MNRKNIKPLVFAMAAALSPFMLPVVAQAAVTANQLPGDGSALYGSASATINGSSMAVNINGTSNGAAILQWGSQGGTLNGNAVTGGFNIGSQASVAFNNDTGQSSDPFVLNIDTTGNLSEIAGALSANGVNLAVANANGILVDGTATINAPDGLALMNQGYTSGNLQAVVTSAVLPLNFANATGGVTIATGATVNADGYVMVAGAGDVNIDAPMVNDGPNTNTSHFYATGTLNINAPVTVDGDDTSFVPIGLAAPTINVNAPVTVNAPVSGGSAGALGILGYSLNIPNNDVVKATLNISSTGSLDAGTVAIEGGDDGASMNDSSSISSIINIVDNGSIRDPYAGRHIYLGGSDYLNGQPVTNGPLGTTGMPAGMTFNAIGSITGSGYIEGDNIVLANQAGSINNITSGQILANGFNIHAGPSGTAHILLSPGMNAGSGINLNVSGNADVYELGQEPSISNSGTSATLQPASDTASKLVVQASGTLTLEGDWETLEKEYSFTSPSGQTSDEFNFPGLVYLLGNQGVTVNAAINSAYSTSTPQGFGVFLLGPTINDTYPIIANGDRGVNLESLNYGPTVINGTNVTQGEPANLPEVYFLQSASGGDALVNTQTFQNEWGWQQQEQTFFAAP
jgi:filamentous hemagglutinin family protein